MNGLARAAVAVCALFGSTPDPSQTHLNRARLERWAGAVRQHAPGQADAAAIDVGSWSVSETSEATNDVVAIVRARREAAVRFSTTGKASDIAYAGQRVTVAEADRLLGLTAGETIDLALDRLLKRAVLLHSDIAMFGPVSPRPSGGAGPPASPTIVIDDGRGEVTSRGEGQGVQWSVARILADEISVSDANALAVRDWYRAAAATLEAQGQWGTAGAHLLRARQSRPSDPGLLFYSGVLHEFLAGATAQAARRTMNAADGARLNIDPEDLELQHAEGFFHRSIQGDASHADAHLRWGHVLGALGRHAEAVRELTIARDLAPINTLKYDALLWLGRSQASAGDRAAARVSYQEAAALFPGAQSALIALSELARRSDDLPLARSTLERLLAQPASRADDPWWNYYFDASTDAATLMAAARAAMLRM